MIDTFGVLVGPDNNGDNVKEEKNEDKMGEGNDLRDTSFPGLAESCEHDGNQQLAMAVGQDMVAA